MRERLAMNLKQLPAVAASWPSGQLPPQQQQQQQVPGLVGGGGLGMPPPSGFAATNVKQLQILSGVLSPLLLHEEAASIFSRVALMFSSTLVEAFGLLESRGPAWEQQLQVRTEWEVGKASWEVSGGHGVQVNTRWAITRAIVT